ncbi:MAG: hypothetical protein M3Q30_10875 [Actinomycetota bacterium]|nr:hypothetical protein [Actinomycetota bacterium]
MRPLACGFVLVFAVGACGGSGVKSSASPTSEGSRRPVLEVAGSEPAASARMVCASEGKQEIAVSVGVDTSRPLVGTWRDHLYSCIYGYGFGQAMTLGVKELSNAAETTAYFNMLGTRYGRMRALEGLGQGAYQTRNGSTVVRKDYRVLFVDDSQFPAQFGRPLSPRQDVSLSVAATIMGCWTGA